MSQTISGSLSAPVTLEAPAYLSPTTITGTIDSGSYAGISIESPWTVDVTGTINSNFAGIFAPAYAAVTNAGYIRGHSFDGIFLDGGGSLDNQTGATLIGALQALYAYYKFTVSVSNAGYVLGGVALKLNGGGYVSNASTGTIIGLTVAVEFSKNGTLENDGRIIDSDSGGLGVSLTGGVIINTGTIEGVTGVRLSGGTLTNSGLIEGETLVTGNYGGTYTPAASATAISFTAPGLFIEDGPGIVLGSVIGDGGTLELGGPGRFTFEGLGSYITGFADDVFAGGANATVEGAQAGFGTISGFTNTDMLIFTDTSADSGTFGSNGLVLNESGTSVGTIAFAGSYAADAFLVIDTPNGTVIKLACFAAGTHILTPNGDTKVENLVPGDLVITRGNGDAPIIWIGKRRIDLTRHPHAEAAQPVCILAGALAEHTPSRNLLLSPDHALLLSGHLVPVKALVNHKNIFPLNRRSITYYHIELATHEVIFAEAAPVETYLDCGNRDAFENAGQVIFLHPDFGQTLREANSCAPFMETGELVDTIRATIAARAYGQAASRT